jgi:hypothetical protein
MNFSSAPKSGVCLLLMESPIGNPASARPTTGIGAIRKRRCAISGLRGRWSAGSRIVEEQVVVNRYDKWLNVPANVERANQRSDQEFGTRTNVRRLADLASRFTLSFWVEMG